MQAVALVQRDDQVHLVGQRGDHAAVHLQQVGHVAGGNLSGELLCVEVGLVELDGHALQLAGGIVGAPITTSSDGLKPLILSVPLTSLVKVDPALLAGCSSRCAAGLLGRKPDHCRHGQYDHQLMLLDHHGSPVRADAHPDRGASSPPYTS